MLTRLTLRGARAARSLADAAAQGGARNNTGAIVDTARAAPRATVARCQAARAAPDTSAAHEERLGAISATVDA